MHMQWHTHTHPHTLHCCVCRCDRHSNTLTDASQLPSNPSSFHSDAIKSNNKEKGGGGGNGWWAWEWSEGEKERQQKGSQFTHKLFRSALTAVVTLMFIILSGFPFSVSSAVFHHIFSYLSFYCSPLFPLRFRELSWHNKSTGRFRWW